MAFVLFVRSCENQVHRPAFSSPGPYGLSYPPMLFHCCATSIMWSAGYSLILLPTSTAKVVMVSDLCPSVPMRPRYSDPLAL